MCCYPPTTLFASFPFSSLSRMLWSLFSKNVPCVASLSTPWKSLHPSLYTHCVLWERWAPVSHSESLFNWVTNCRSWQHTKVKKNKERKKRRKRQKLKAASRSTLAKLHRESKSKQPGKPDSECQGAFKEQREAIKWGGLTRRFNIPLFIFWKCHRCCVPALT